MGGWLWVALGGVALGGSVKPAWGLAGRLGVERLGRACGQVRVGVTHSYASPANEAALE